MNFKDLKVKSKITVVVIGVAILASLSGIVSVFMMSNIQHKYDDALQNFGFAQGDMARYTTLSVIWMLKLAATLPTV